MEGNQIEPEQPSPADIAREVLRHLATRSIPPTPDAYREIYDEIAGAKASSASANSNTDGTIGRADASALDTGSIPLLAPTEAAPAKKDSYPLVDKPEPAHAKSKPIFLTDTIEQGQASAAQITNPVTPGLDDGQQARMLRELLIGTLTLPVSSLLQVAPELADESDALALSIKDARTEQALNEIGARLKQLCFKIELRSGDMAEEHDLLLSLLKLLLGNIGELLENDSWLSGQIAAVQNLLAGPISHTALTNATHGLKDVIYKQGMLKHSLAEAKVTVKNMMITFIDRLGAVASSTSEYHEKIDRYSYKISQARDISELNTILEDVMRDTKIAQTEALRSRDEMVAARQEVQEAEARILELQSRLKQMSELVREDQLTGSLNRRGLDDVFAREMARSERRHSPLSIALLDLDDFKRLNDTYGHTAGDEALIHLVRVIKETLRTMDVVARFGGEEFLIVLPDTSPDDAIVTVTRLQRELAKRNFMYNHERLLMTFSAGVTLCVVGEDQASVVKRADEALYKAKKAGKNCVVAGD